MADAEPGLRHGSVVWVRLDPVEGREQHGHRPALVVASDLYLDVVDTLAIVVPITTVDRGWDNHIPVSGLRKPSWAMTEQLRTVSRNRITSVSHVTDDPTLVSVREWIGHFLGLDAR